MVERLALLAIVTFRVVLAIANQASVATFVESIHALGSVAIALATPADGDLRNGVEVRLKDGLFAVHFIAESVHLVEGYPDLCRRYPVLIKGKKSCFFFKSDSSKGNCR